MSERFPGYLSENEAQRRHIQIEQAATNQRLAETLNLARQTAAYVQQSLPLLIAHATDQALPTEVKQGKLWKRTHVEYGWVVRTIYHESTESTRSSSGAASETLFVLTESGLIGSAIPVNRGVNALMMNSEPEPITPEIFTFEGHAREVTVGIQSILHNAGVGQAES